MASLIILNRAIHCNFPLQVVSYDDSIIEVIVEIHRAELNSSTNEEIHELCGSHGTHQQHLTTYSARTRTHVEKKITQR
jgi:hypothetical protein